MSGLVAVGHEVLWTRRLLDLLGGASDSAAIAFGTFVLGLALGSGLASAVLCRVPDARSRELAALCQCLGAAAAVPLLLSSRLSGWIWPLVGAELLAHPAGAVLRSAVAVVLVLLPSVFFGAFLPFLLTAISTPTRPVARFGPLYYGLNTLGGLAGALVVPTVLAPIAGLLVSGAVLSALNLALAAACLTGRAAAEDGPQRAAGAAPGGAAGASDTSRWLRAVGTLGRRSGGPGGALQHPSSLRWGAHLLPAFGTGCFILAAEMLLFHHFGQILASSLHTSVAVLGTVLLGLGLGSLAASGMRGSQRWMVGSLLATLLLTAGQPVLFCSLSAGLRPLPIHAGAIPYALRAAGIAAVAVLPLMLAAGTLFPLLFARIEDSLGDSRGTHWGVLVLANGLGCFGGALLAQYVLMPLFGPWWGMGILAAAASGVWFLLVIRLRLWGWMATGVALALFAGPRAALYGRLPVFHSPSRDWEDRRVDCGSDGIAVLLESPATGHRRILLNNSYGIGGSHSVRLDHMQMLLPLVLHEAPRRVAAVGLGAGFTAEAALLDPGVQRLDGVEISSLILTLAAEGFPKDRGGLFSDPRSRVHCTDGRLFLAAQRNAYDVILGDLFVPWREGMGGLYSLEFCRGARDALADGGIYCQWIPLYQVRREELNLIADTFLAVFPDAWVMRNSFALRHPAIALVGRKGTPLVDEASLQRRCAALRRLEPPVSAFLRHPEGVSMHVIGPAESVLTRGTGLSRPRLNTLDNAWLGYMAARAVLRGDWQNVTGGAFRDLLASAGAADAERTPGVGPRRPNASAADLWLDAQYAALRREDAAVHAAVAEALRQMPKAVLHDPAFRWEDLLVDVPLPIPRNYLEVAESPSPRD